MKLVEMVILKKIQHEGGVLKQTIKLKEVDDTTEGDVVVT